MEKQSEEPMNAIMLSKAGKMTAMSTMLRMVDARRARRARTVVVVVVVRVEEAWGEMPQRVSRVETMGRAARGILVRGMMAMKTLMVTVREGG